MRAFVIVVLVVLAAYFGYRQFGPSPDPETSGDSSAAAGEGDARPGEPPRVAPSQEDRLRETIAGTSSPERDRERFQLSQILLAKTDQQAKLEGVDLLENIARAKGEYSAAAASALFRESQGEGRVERARMVAEFGPATKAYPEALFTLGQELVGKPEDSNRVRAWELLSQAYFGTDNPALRDEIRPVVQGVANELLLSPRRTEAAQRYTVVQGDNLASIAKRFGTTVDLIQYLNGLKGTIIHPRDSLKILTGEVSVIVDKSDYRLDVLLDGKFLYSAPVGLGRHGKTPTAEFVIEDRQEKPAWYRPGQPAIPYGDPENPLGEVWLGFRDTDEHKGFGIHGTDKPETIGTESSDGCVRLRNEDVLMLYRLISPGAKVTIRE